MIPVHTPINLPFIHLEIQAGIKALQVITRNRTKQYNIINII